MSYTITDINDDDHYVAAGFTEALNHIADINNVAMIHKVEWISDGLFYAEVKDSSYYLQRDVA